MAFLMVVSIRIGMRKASSRYVRWKENVGCAAVEYDSPRNVQNAIRSPVNREVRGIDPVCAL